MNEKFTELNDTLKVLAQHTEELNLLRSEVSSLKKVVSVQQKKLHDFEDRSRRRNLIIFGQPEEVDENPTILKENILDVIFSRKLGVTVTSVERVNRLGKKKGDKPRPVIINFFDYNKKMRVLQICSKLKDSNISICHDFCKATLDKRANLWKYGKQFKSLASKISLDYDRLRVDNDVYIWDEGD
ncbi:uncharacterized protein LOC144107314 [Amblyomma americanum]